jgi:pSer/pThr/pTyr-binding forkhead associated (FHA) protein
MCFEHSMDAPTSQPVLVYVGLNGPLTLSLGRNETCVGRLPDQDLILRDKYVSRRHAVINRVDRAFELTDKQSTHGTYLIGARCRPQKSDVLLCGGSFERIFVVKSAQDGR